MKRVKEFKNIFPEPYTHDSYFIRASNNLPIAAITTNDDKLIERIIYIINGDKSQPKLPEKVEFCKEDQILYVGNKSVIMMRALEYLTSSTGCDMDYEDAIIIQDNMGYWLENVINNHQPKKYNNEMINDKLFAIQANICANQEKEIKQFISEHSDCGNTQNTCIGERFEYIFIPTGIGVVQKVKCRICGSEKDITDYNSW